MKVDIRQILARGLLSQIRKAGPPLCSVPVGDVQTAAGKKWASGLTEAQRDALNTWQSHGHMSIREFQLFGEGSDRIKNLTTSLGKAWKKAPKHKGTVYRGMRLNLRQARKTFRKGVEIETEAFTSTSVKREIAERFTGTPVIQGVQESADYLKARARIIMEIRNPKTGRQIWAAGREDELEVLFGEGARFRVLNVKLQVFERGIRVNRLHVILEEII